MKIYIAADQMITSAAVGTGGNFDALLNGRSGVRKVDNPALSGSPVMCGYISANVYEALAEKYGYDLSRTELLAVASVNEMLLGLSGDRIDKLQSSRVGMVIATAKGDISAIEGRCNAGQFIPGKDDPVLLAADFMGRTASFPAGPYILAGKMGVPVFFYMPVRRPHRTFRFRFVRADIPAPRSVTHPEQQILGQFISVLEEEMCVCPEQWYNYFDFWKFRKR